MPSMTGPLFVDGVPVGGSSIPTTFGTTFYVDADSGDDGRDGTTMDKAKKTVLAGYGLMTTNKHDVLVMSGVSAHTLTTTLTVAKNRCHFVGLGGGSRYIGQRTRWEMGVTTGAEISLCTNTGVGNTFTNIKMRSVDTNTSSLYTFVDAGEYTQMTNVSIEHAGLLATAGTAELLCISDSPLYKSCTFGNMIYEVTSTTRGCVSFNGSIAVGTSQCRDAKFVDCDFLCKPGATTSCFAYIPNATDIERFLIFKDCTFITNKIGAATMALAIVMTTIQTYSYVLLKNCVVVGATDTGTTTRDIYTTSPTAAADGTEAVAVTTT